MGTFTEDSIANGVFAAAGQFWITNTVWAKGGIGLGTVASGGETDTGLGLTAAVGVELKQGKRFTIDVSGRIVDTNSDTGHLTQFAVLAGFNWY